MSAGPFLLHQFLIAMPGMGDPNFSQTVTLLIQHSEEGAMGIVINRPTTMHMAQVFEQLRYTCVDESVERQPVYQGGPMQTELGFVVHRALDHVSTIPNWEQTIRVSDRIHVTTSRDILAAMARGEEPRSALVALGYAGWGAGQLEAEIAANAWLTVECDENILFDTPFDQRWRAAGRLLGIDVMNLGTDAGHA